MRRSGARPAVKRSKASLRDVAPCGIGPHRGDAIVEIRRRLADRGRGHQRMAGGAVLAAPGRRRAAASGRGLRLRRRRRISDRRRCCRESSKSRCRRIGDALGRAAATACAGTRSSAAAISIAPARLRHRSFRQTHSCPSVAVSSRFRRPCHGFQQLNRGGISLSPPASARARRNNWHHTSAFVPGCKPATNVQSKHFPVPHSSSPRHPDIP